MKIVDGVQLHLIKTKKFKTNHITARFLGDLSQKSVAKRVLVAQMLATANEVYPTAQKFRHRLAELYGATLSTNVSTKGLVHFVDIDITFVQDQYTFTAESVLEEVLLFLKGVLFSPLLSVAQYQPKVFEIEKNNLINYLEADREDSFYYSSLQTRKLFFTDLNLQDSKYGSSESVQKETAYTSYQEFHKMIMEDQIDIYIVGEFDDYRVVQLLHQFPFTARQKTLHFFYRQDYVNVVKESIEQKDINQSVLELAYYCPVNFGESDYFALIILNGMIGSFSHSTLFTKIREDEGLAYSIGSRLDVYTGMLAIYAGIEQKDRTKALQLIIKEINDIKMGRFSSSLIEKTKSMIRSQLIQSEDNCKVIIDREFTRKYIDETFSMADWIKNINKIRKKDIVTVANQLKLQTLFFLEGTINE
ncbi:EF-P 5-aminopentanol modification-associated protein YfmF [Streptococcus iniae]|uniref:Peptidase M16 n=1 Tax=Streptococcus iniae TaxID=1346 RepID=A0ABM5QKD3_STRIN|nr:pitrilysin family protein [Streptococcus iniae]AGM99940.1 zinc protease [Streptococcus iniae SF1]AHY16781.1 peptidase M16 [Streptococcus iniae]AHY18646.1 peptidase M16 [Streptococcus iniae]APD32805.1 peptidase M16 [Streptococcus iniae]ASL35834.1 zinc protease [Streptococcus iniae]